MNVEIVKSSDGSNTLFSNIIGEHYHSTFGAKQESEHIFINSGLIFLANNIKCIKIFEVGFGTGLNAILTYIASKNLNLKIEYHSIESYPLDINIIKKLDYNKLFDEMQIETFYKIHNVEWDKLIEIDNNFSIKKIKNKIEEYDFNEVKFDLIYFDAFSREKQPELWSYDIINKISKNTNLNGVFVTYSCNGDLKRNLKSLGFKIEKIPGPIGKREILRAIKIS